MKILFVTTISNTINAFLIPHIRYLVAQGNQVDIATNITQEISQEIVELGCKIFHIHFQRSPINSENVRALKELQSVLQKEKYDLVHTHTPVASFLTRWACRKFKGMQVIYTAHGFHFYKGASFKNWLLYHTIEKLMAKWTDMIITINEEDYAAAKKFKPRNHQGIFRVSGVGIDLKKFYPIDEESKVKARARFGYNPSDFILIYAAELNANKHQDLIIEALHLLKNKIPHLKLLLAGEGPLKPYYESMVESMGLQENVHFLNYRPDVPELLKIADVAVSASRREGLPVNIMEAMATGLPLIVTDCRGNRDLVRHGENGFVVGLNDVAGFANAIETLYLSKDLRLKYGQENAIRVKEYSIDHVIHQMGGIYGELLSKSV